jgi:hypothetical protein
MSALIKRWACAVLQDRHHAIGHERRDTPTRSVKYIGFAQFVSHRPGCASWCESSLRGAFVGRRRPGKLLSTSAGTSCAITFVVNPAVAAAVIHHHCHGRICHSSSFELVY